jgi:DNA repair exonuclease SbcCD nuclease subunit
MGYNFGMKLSRYHIAWISDIHIGSADQQPNGVDVRGNFTRALEDICRFDVDMLVLGGDLCLDSGERDAYLWISRELDRLNPARRIVVLPGNHDDPEMMAQIRNPVDLGGGLPRVEILDPEGITPAAGIRRCFSTAPPGGSVMIRPHGSRKNWRSLQYRARRVPREPLPRNHQRQRRDPGWCLCTTPHCLRGYLIWMRTILLKIGHKSPPHFRPAPTRYGSFAVTTTAMSKLPGAM